MVYESSFKDKEELNGIEIENQPDKKELDWKTAHSVHLKYRRNQCLNGQ